MSPSSVCEKCTRLNIESLLVPKDNPYQACVFELQNSASTCRFCHMIYSELSDSRRTPLSFRQLLRRPTYTKRIQVRARLAEEKNRILFKTSPSVPSKTDEAEAWKKDASVTVDLQVWTLEDDPAIKHGIPRRAQLGTNTGSIESLKVAKDWLQNCIEKHVGLGACRFDPENSRYGGSEMPTRLIDSSRGFDNLRLIAGKMSDPAYVALSYVWGTENPTWKTVHGNVKRRMDGFSIQELPQTLRDAIAVTTALGMHLTWIDAICIVQNDAEEWERESVKMDIIYSSAAVTLMASNSSSSTAGLFNDLSKTCDDFEDHGMMLESTLEDGLQSRLLLTRPPMHKQWLEMVRSAEVEEATLFERGWCFQEWMLSPRKLYFSQSQLFWECTPGCLSEDGLWTYKQYHRGLTQALMSYLEGRGQAEKSWSMGMNMLWYHDSVSQAYSDRQLTNQSDRLLAISGLAKMMQLAVPSRYLAGIWEHSLPGGLCWRKISSGGKCSQYVAPSWSWASQDGMIEYEIDTLDPKNRNTECEVKDAWVRTKGGDEMGLVVAGEIVLHAPTFQAKIGMMIKSEGFYEVDDDPPLEHVLYPDRPTAETMRWTVRGLVADSDEDVDELPVTAIIIFEDQEKEQLGAIIVEEVEVDINKRIGFLWTKMTKEQRSYLMISMKTVKVV